MRPVQLAKARKAVYEAHLLKSQSIDALDAWREKRVGAVTATAMGDPDSQAALAAAVEKVRVEEVTRLYHRDDVPKENCWMRGKGWSLAHH